MDVERIQQTSEQSSAVIIHTPPFSANPEAQEVSPTTTLHNPEPTCEGTRSPFPHLREIQQETFMAIPRKCTCTLAGPILCT